MDEARKCRIRNWRGEAAAVRPATVTRVLSLGIPPCLPAAQPQSRVAFDDGNVEMNITLVA
jgi:hypothetical protein